MQELTTTTTNKTAAAVTTTTKRHSPGETKLHEHAHTYIKEQKPLSLHNYVSCQIITCGVKPISDGSSRSEQY